MHPTGEDNRPQGEDKQRQWVEPLYQKWLGHPVVINYTRGTSYWDLERPYEIARGAIEGREALFVLEQTGPVGVGVRRIIENDEGDEEFAEISFIPWSAINVIYSILDEESEVESDEQPSDE